MTVHSHILLRVLTLLLCVLAFPGCVAAGREGPLVRQEAPFPTIFGPPAADTAEPVRYEVLRGDFHMHTVHSDGTLSPAQRVIEAWQYGYDVIAITDHGDFRSYEEALPTAKTLGILLVRGMETGLSGREHLVALDFSAGYQPRNPHQWSETPGQPQVFYQDEWRTLAAAGAFVLYAHPHVGLRDQMLWGIGQGLLQGIEVKNDVVGSEWNTVQSLGTWWYPFALDWAVERNLTIFADSDVHAARGPIEQATTLVLVKDRSPQGVMEALRARRTLAQFNGMLCAHEWVLKLLMASLVDVNLTEMEDGKVFLRLHNRGPVPLTAQIADMPVEPVTLSGYQQVLVGLRRTPDVVTIIWKNLYLRPTENLTTTYPLVALARPEQVSTR
ncbi:MAG: PHP domain-containing protein [Planctomycetes bacterium]|nr:PHP domain-containing protein [Planctomycetota bacterium]